VTGSDPGKRGLSLGASALLVLLGCVVGLVLAEIGLRFAPDRPHKYIMSDPILHHRLRPNVTTSVRGVPLQTNSMGLRDREVSLAKPPGTFRILMLGDSFTEGAGLPLGEIVAKRVEATLNHGRCAGRYEVINGGVSSYSPLLEYLFLKHVGLALTPDLAVLNFDMTDVHDDLVRTPIARLGPDGLPLAVPTDRRKETAILLPPISKPPLLRFLDPVEALLDQSKLYQTLRTSALGQWALGTVTLTPERLEALGLVGNVQYDIEAITRDGESPGTRKAWDLTERYISGIQSLARAHGMAFVLVVYPHAQQVAAGESPGGRRRFGLGPGLYATERPFEILEALGRREGFPVINLLRLFREREPREGPLFRDDDIHHTVAGARVFAEGISSGLSAERLIPCLATQRRPNRGRRNEDVKG